jgi:hypothetical protein
MPKRKPTPAEKYFVVGQWGKTNNYVTNRYKFISPTGNCSARMIKEQQ